MSKQAHLQHRILPAARERLEDRVVTDRAEKQLMVALFDAHPGDFSTKEQCACVEQADCDECLGATGVRQAINRLFAQRFREVARAAGISDDVWNMDSRADAVAEAYDKGAREEDAMDLATHQERKTNQRYNRGRMAKTSRVSTLRFGPKNEP